MSLETPFLDEEQNYIMIVSWYTRMNNVPKDLEKLIQEYVLTLFYVSYCTKYTFLSNKYAIFSERYIKFAIKFTNFNWVHYLTMFQNLPMNIIKFFINETWDKTYGGDEWDLQYLFNTQNNIPITYIRDNYSVARQKINRIDILIKKNLSYETLEDCRDFICSKVYNLESDLDLKKVSISTLKFLKKFHPQFKTLNIVDNNGYLKEDTVGNLFGKNNNKK